MTDVKTELAHIDGMLNNPLNTIKTQHADIRTMLAEKDLFKVIGAYQAIISQVLDDISAIKDYIHEQVD